MTFSFWSNLLDCGFGHENQFSLVQYFLQQVLVSNSYYLETVESSLWSLSLLSLSKHRNDHRKKLTKPDGFDRLSHRELPISEN